jgi:hypothetical protein
LSVIVSLAFYGFGCFLWFIFDEVVGFVEFFELTSGEELVFFEILEGIS